MSNLTRPTLSLALVVLVAACSGSGGSTPPTSAPSRSPDGTTGGVTTSSPDFGALEHPTGATDVLLRYDVGGGMMMAGWAASQVPIFTLYGDGTVVFRNPTLEMPEPQGSVSRTNPLRTAKLSEDQIQKLLVLALGEGGLGVARAQYDNPTVTDVGTTTFEIDGGGIKKTVSIYALGFDSPGVPDLAARKAFSTLADRLADFDQGGSIATDPFEPTAYRGILMDGTGMVVPDAIAWPWSDVKPAEFKGPSDPNAFQLATRTMTPAEIEALGVDGPEGGFQGLVVNGPDGRVYALNVRPLLPDETE